MSTVLKNIILFFGVVTFLFIGACKKEKISYSTTPYKLETPNHFPQMEIPEDNPMTVEGVQLGRKLFF
jgi:cytochrome c peroxidase